MCIADEHPCRCAMLSPFSLAPVRMKQPRPRCVPSPSVPPSAMCKKSSAPACHCPGGASPPSASRWPQTTACSACGPEARHRAAGSTSRRSRPPARGRARKAREGGRGKVRRVTHTKGCVSTEWGRAGNPRAIQAAAMSQHRSVTATLRVRQAGDDSWTAADARRRSGTAGGRCSTARPASPAQAPCSLPNQPAKRSLTTGTM